MKAQPPGAKPLAGYTAVIPAAGSSRRLAHLTRDRPKSLLEFADKAIIEHGLDVLASRGLRHAILVVGYHREKLTQRVGARRSDLRVEFVESPDYATTEHGWSLFLGLRQWARDSRPLLLIDADNLYDPGLLDHLLALDAPDVALVDASLVAEAREEELVLGRSGRVQRLVRGHGRDFEDVVGGFVGINKFSTAFAAGLLAFMDEHFQRHVRDLKYERIIDRYIETADHSLMYLDCNAREWINVNHESEFPAAARVAELMRTDG